MRFFLLIRFRLSAIVLIAAAVGLTAMACGLPNPNGTWPVAAEAETFSIAGKPTVIVNNFNGRVVVSGSDHTDRVEVVAELRRPNGLEYWATQDGDTVTVGAAGRGFWAGIFPWGRRAQIGIVLPSDSDVEVRVENGAIKIGGVSGTVQLHASNGSIQADDASGEYDITTFNGKIAVQEGMGAFDLSTSNGPIRFQGELAAGTDNRFRTSNGSVKATLRGESPSVSVQARTSNGSIDINAGAAQSALGRNHKEAVIGRGDARLELVTSNGSITVE